MNADTLTAAYTAEQLRDSFRDRANARYPHAERYAARMYRSLCRRAGISPL